MKKLLLLLLGLTIAVGASAGVDSWRSHHPAKKQRTERSITDRTAKKQSALDLKASHAQKHHAKPQTKPFQGKSTGKLRDGDPVVITEQPEGTLVTYLRTGYFIDSYDRPTAFNAEVNIVYGLDGQTVYIQDPVFPPQFNTWVMGTISNDKIHVPLGQYVNADYGVLLAWGTCTMTATIDPDDDPYVFTPDASATEVTYTISGNTITMDNTTAGNNGDGAVGLAILMDNGDPYFMMEYNAVFTEKEKPTVIDEQPEGTVAYYKRTGYYYDYNYTTILPQMGLVTMVYDPDGTTVYIKDLVYSDFTGNWVRGTIEDGKIHVPMGQYVYVDYDNEGNYLYGLFLAWSYVGEAYDDYNDEYYISFFNEPSVTEVTYTIDGDNLIMDNSYGTPDGLYSSGLGLMWDDEDYGFGTEWYTTFTPTEAPTVIENQPEGDLVSYARTVQYYDYYYQEMYNSTSDFNVVYASDGQTVYVQDPVGSFGLGSWVKGTVNGNKITVPLGQYLYVDDDARMLLVWGTNYDEGKYYTLLPDPAVTEVTFTIDDQGYVTIDNSSPGIMGNGAVGLGLMLDDGTESLSLEWSVPTLPPPITEQPEGELKTYDRSGYYYYSDGSIYNQEGTVNIVYASDGETVYIQDILCNSEIGTWVMGTIEGGKIHVPLGQTVAWFDEDMWGVMLAWGQTYYDDDSGSYLFENDPTVTEVTFTINGNTISMDNSSFGPNDDIDGATGLCGIYSDIPIWFAQCDLMTVFTAPEPTPVVITEQPEGDLVTYLRAGEGIFLADPVWKDNKEEGDRSYINFYNVRRQGGEVSVVFAPDGETVYLQDPVDCNWYYNTGAWVKGTLSADGTKISVPVGQYVSWDDDYGYGKKLVWGYTSVEPYVPEETYVQRIIFTPDPSVTEITYTIQNGCISLDNSSGPTVSEHEWLMQMAYSGQFSDEAVQNKLHNMYTGITGVAYIDNTNEWTEEINWGTKYAGRHAVKPQDPEELTWYDCGDESGDSRLVNPMELVGIDGMPLYEDAISYSIYIDNDELYNFSAQQYDLDDDVTEITYDMWQENWRLYPNNVYFFRTNADGFTPFFNWRIGIQLHYTIDGVRNSSNIVYVEVFDQPTEVPGDVNGDGELKITDVTLLIDMLLEGGDIPVTPATDANGDGKVNITDLTAIIDMLLS